MSDVSTLDALQSEYLKVCSEIGEKYLARKGLDERLEMLTIFREGLVHQMNVHKNYTKDTSNDVNPIDV